MAKVITTELQHSGASSANITLDSSGNSNFSDNAKLRLGTGNDLDIYHDNSVSSGTSFIDNATGELRIRSEYIALQPEGGGEQMLYGSQGGSVQLYYDGVKKFETNSTGVEVTGGIRLGGNNTANEMDDYEEGSWTPVVKIGGSTSGITTSVLSGKYTKVGRMVHICCGVVLTNKGSDSGNILFEGLPFAVSDMLAGTSNDAGGVAWYQAGMNNLTTDGIIQARFVNSQIELKYLNSTNNSVSVSGGDLQNDSSWRLDGI